MNDLKVSFTAIVPALNEEKNVGAVLKTLLESKIFEEVILVDDGSIDKTAEIGLKAGAKVISLSKIGGSGKGNSMRQGVITSHADVIIFFDADLIGLTKEHIILLVESMIKEKTQMCVGIRGRWWGLPKILAKIDPLSAIGGERAVTRNLFLSIPEKLISGFAIETAINYYCLVNKLAVKYVILKKLTVVSKEKKEGLVKGFLNRIKMIGQIIKTRIKILTNKNEFIQKNNTR